MLDDAVALAGLNGNGTRVAEIAELFLAGVDFPAEERQLQQAVEARDWAARTIVGNDTFAVLARGDGPGLGRGGRLWGRDQLRRRGARRAPAALPRARRDHGRLGRRVRRRPLSAVGGGAERAGRGPSTSLERAVPAHFGLQTPFELAEAIHGGSVANRRLIELAPVVFAEAAHDPVAAEILERLAQEIVRSPAWRSPGSASVASRWRCFWEAGSCGRRTAGCSAPSRQVYASSESRSWCTARRLLPSSEPRSSGSTLLARARRRELGRGPRSGLPWTRTTSSAWPRGGLAMADVRFEQATRIYPGNDVPAVDRLDLHIEDGEFMVLVGPSGSGKSTALRMLAGLEDVDEGGVWVGGRDVTYARPKDRDVAMVFQNYALYPYLTVAANIGFPLKVAKVGRAERDRRVREVADMLGLSDLLERKPAQLSGGQRQRVAMGRAIVRQPVCT